MFRCVSLSLIFLFLCQESFAYKGFSNSVSVLGETLAPRSVSHVLSLKKLLLERQLKKPEQKKRKMCKVLSGDIPLKMRFRLWLCRQEHSYFYFSIHWFIYALVTIIVDVFPISCNLALIYTILYFKNDTLYQLYILFIFIGALFLSGFKTLGSVVGEMWKYYGREFAEYRARKAYHQDIFRMLDGYLMKYGTTKISMAQLDLLESFLMEQYSFDKKSFAVNLHDYFCERLYEPEEGVTLSFAQEVVAGLLRFVSNPDLKRYGEIINQLKSEEEWIHFRGKKFFPKDGGRLLHTMPPILTKNMRYTNHVYYFFIYFASFLPFEIIWIVLTHSLLLKYSISLADPMQTLCLMSFIYMLVFFCLKQIIKGKSCRLAKKMAYRDDLDYRVVSYRPLYYRIYKYTIRTVVEFFKDFFISIRDFIIEMEQRLPVERSARFKEELLIQFLYSCHDFQRFQGATFQESDFYCHFLDYAVLNGISIFDMSRYFEQFGRLFSQHFDYQLFAGLVGLLEHAQRFINADIAEQNGLSLGLRNYYWKFCQQNPLSQVMVMTYFYRQIIQDCDLLVVSENSQRMKSSSKHSVVLRYSTKFFSVRMGTYPILYLLLVGSLVFVVKFVTVCFLGDDISLPAVDSEISLLFRVLVVAALCGNAAAIIARVIKDFVERPLSKALLKVKYVKARHMLYHQTLTVQGVSFLRELPDFQEDHYNWCS